MNEFSKFAYKSLLLGSRYLEKRCTSYVNRLVDEACMEFDKGNTESFFRKVSRVEYTADPLRNFFRDTSKTLEFLLRPGRKN